MKKYLIPASITAVAVGAFLVFQNAGYVQTVQLSTWRPVADLTAWPETTAWPKTNGALPPPFGALPGAGPGMNSPVQDDSVRGVIENLDHTKTPKTFEHCEYRIKYGLKGGWYGYLYPTQMVGLGNFVLSLQFSTKNGSLFDFHQSGQSNEYPKTLELAFAIQNSTILQAKLTDLSPPPPVQYSITKNTVINVIKKPKNPVKLGENIESVIMESRCYMRHRSSVLDDEAKSVVGAKIGNES